MLGAVVFLEAMLLLAAAAWTWWRARPVPPPFGKPLVEALGWVLLQGALLAAGYFTFLARLEGPDSGPRVGGAAWPLYAIQALRTLALLMAAGAWLRVLKSAQISRRRRWFLGAALALSWFAPLPGSVLLLILLMRMNWVESLHGWRRAAALAGAVVAFLALLIWPVTRLAGGVAQTTLYGFTDARSVPLLQGELPPGALAPAALARPFDFAFRFLTDLLRVQALALVLQLLSLPVHLRGLSLKRRFALAFSLYRVIPGFLTALVMMAGVYFGLGFYKSRIVNHAFLDMVRSGRTAAVLMLSAQPQGAIDGTAAAEAARAQEPWLAAEGASAHVLLRRVALPMEPPMPADSLAEVRLPQFEIWSSPGTPPQLREANLFGAGEADTLGGLFLAGNRLYLAALVARRSGGEALLGEVYVPVDSLFLAGIAARAGADVHIRTLPGVRISPTTIQFGGGDQATPLPAEAAAPAYAITAPFGEAAEGLMGTKRLMARQFLPLLDWRHETEDGVAGTALLTLSSSPALLARGIVTAPYALSSNLFAIGILLAVLLLFGLAESSAVRTGRSIIDGILEDAKGLAAAAQRFGSGHLDYRIPSPGRDELGRLASAFNAMAADLKLRQEELIEKERLEADLAMARRIQERLLPQEPPSLPRLDVAGISIPSLEVGGDLFHFLTPPDGSLGIAIGDVAGKSMPAALLMSNALAILRAETRLESDTAMVLTQMNALIAEQVEPGRFLTFFYGVVDAPGSRMRYACAGHNPPLLVRAGGACEWLEPGGPALGILPEATYATAEVALGPGDMLVLYSDGLTEASRPRPGAGGSAGAEDAEEFFGEERLLEAACARRHESAQAVLDGLVSAVQDFAGEAPQSDDLTLVVVRVRDAVS